MKRIACLLMIAGAALYPPEDPCSAQEAKPRATLHGHTPGKRISFSFRADGRMLVSGSWDGTIKLWDLASGKEVAAFKDLAAKGAWIWSVAVTSDGKTLASGNKDGTVGVWDVATGKSRTTFKSKQNMIRAVAFSADGKTLVSGDGNGTISVWDMTTGKERAALKANSGLRVGTVLFSTDDKVLAVSSSPAPTEAELGLRDEVRLWDTATLKELCALQTNQLDVSIALASDGKTLASADRIIKLWSVATGKELRSLNGGGVALAFSPGEGKTLLSAGSGGTIKWWDVVTGEERGTRKTHEKEPHAFSPNSKLLATVDNKTGVIELWDVPEAPR